MASLCAIFSLALSHQKYEKAFLPKVSVCVLALGFVAQSASPCINTRLPYAAPPHALGARVQNDGKYFFVCMRGAQYK